MLIDKSGICIEFAALQAEHIDGVAEIERSSFKDPWSRAAFERELENPVAVYVVALYCGRVIAYGGLWHILDEGHITNIAVSEGFRGKGVGDALVGRLLETAAGMGMRRFTLEVRVSNSAARSLYEKHGFVCAGIRRGYYQDGEDAAIYWTEDPDAVDN